MTHRSCAGHAHALPPRKLLREARADVAPIGGLALCRRLRWILTVAAADEALAEREGSDLKEKASGGKAQVRILQRSMSRVE